MKQKLNITFENVGGKVGSITLKALNKAFKPALKVASLKYKTRRYEFKEVNNNKFIVSIIGSIEDIKDEQEALIKGLTKLVNQYQETEDNKSLLKRLGEKALDPIREALNKAYMKVGIYITWEIKDQLKNIT